LIVLIRSRATYRLDPFDLLATDHFITHSHLAPVNEATNLPTPFFHYADYRIVLPLRTAS
jgi:hypothetical protein